MKCDVFQAEISARLDGARNADLDASLTDHVASCARCASFEARAGRVRQLVRFEEAREVPDIVPRIMRAVRAEPRRVVLLRDRHAWKRPALAFLAGAVASALVFGEVPAVQRGVPPALAADVPRLVAAAAQDVSSYRATLRIVERNFHRQVRERQFVADVSFRAPERFVAQLRDVTRYPSASWPRNDMTLAVDGSRWSLHAPSTCPREALPGCAADSVTRNVRGRQPFDSDAPLPTDVVVPVSSLAGGDRVSVTGASRVLGRVTVTVALSYADARPLFAYLQESSQWRPFFPTDRVLVQLDDKTWFPLAYEVRASPGAERRAWAAQNGLPDERAGEQIFDARATSFGSGDPIVAAAPSASRAIDAGFRDGSLRSIAVRAGYEPVQPAQLHGLETYRAGMFSGGGRPADEVLVSFAKGLAWLKIRQTRTWTRPAFFGDLDELATPVPVGNGVGYYEPATDASGRRLGLHGAGWDIYLESTLPFADLIEVAGSIPVRGLAVPGSWLRGQSHTTLPTYALTPAYLPRGYRIAVIDAGSPATTTYFRRLGREPDGIGIRLYQAPGDSLEPPMNPDTLSLRLRGVVARYAPERGELEWIEHGIYRSLFAESIDLSTLVRIAESLQRAGADQS